MTCTLGWLKRERASTSNGRPLEFLGKPAVDIGSRMEMDWDRHVRDLLDSSASSAAPPPKG